jgi:hypothetical protein
MHDGDSPGTEAAVRRQRGEATTVRRQYEQLTPTEKQQLQRKRRSNPPSQAAEPVVKCGYGSSDERSHGKTTDTGRDSADCVGV